MRLKWAFPLIAAVAGLGTIGGRAPASHCGAGAYPADCSSSEQCCLPAVRYQICYRTVEE